MKMTAYRKWIAQVAVMISVCSLSVAADKHAVHSDSLHHPGGHAIIPSHKQAFTLHSGIFDGRIGASYEPASVLRNVIEIPDVPWLKLYFGNCELGSRSYLKITSQEDGAYQYLNSTSLKQWYNTSAFFNGDGVEIELFVAPEDKGILFEVKEVLVGESPENYGRVGATAEIASAPCPPPPPPPSPTWLCGIIGTDDDRVSSSDQAIGRIIRVNAAGVSRVGTGFITSNGTHIHSGHTFPLPSGDVIMLEFNVPLSDPNGVPTYSNPSNQYSIDIPPGYSGYENGGPGRDWSVFGCHPNSNTGLLPVQAQKAFYRLSLDNNNPAIIRVTGYGLDECPPGPAGGANSSSSTLQTAIGDNDGPGDSEIFNSLNGGLYWRYLVDVRVGSCGSPVIAEGTGLAIGVQNFCQSNRGTSLELDAFENAVNDFPGANIRYADNGHPFATGAGTVFRPFSTVAGAVAAVLAGGIVSVVQGSYNESLTISTAMTIVAPVGNVTIGPGPSPVPKIAEDGFRPAEEDRDNMAAPSEYNLSQNYPNPFNPQTTIEYALPKASFVKLQIFDTMGQEVRTLVNEFQQPGFKSAIWDGRNNQGQLAPSGVYLYKIVTDGFTQSSKSILLK